MTKTRPPGVEQVRARADRGDAAAQFNLGFMYETGAGVPQDDREAVRWWRLAADQGNAEAQSALLLPPGVAPVSWTPILLGGGGIRFPSAPSARAWK